MSAIRDTDFGDSDRSARQKRFVIEILILATVIFIGWPSFYIVDQSEQAVVTMFGKPVKIILNPIEDSNAQALMDRLRKKYEAEGITVTTGAGLRLKIPYIQKAEKLERRLLRWNGYPEQIPTKDKKYIWVASTARWYIEDPLQFLRSVSTEEQAHARLDDIIDSTARNSITSRDLLEIVRTKDRQMQVAEEELRETIQVGKVTEGRAAIVREITEISSKACEEYGIRIHPEGVLIKGLTYVEAVKEKVEDRMIEERLRIAKKYTSEGEGEYERIMGNKERDVKTILSEAYRTAREIEGQADAKATEIFAAAYNKDPEFYRFWKTLELYETSLGGEKTKLMLGTDNSLFEYFKGQKKP